MTWLANGMHYIFYLVYLAKRKEESKRETRVAAHDAALFSLEDVSFRPLEAGSNGVRNSISSRAAIDRVQP